MRLSVPGWCVNVYISSVQGKMVASLPAVIVCVVLQQSLVSNSVSCCWPKGLSLAPLHTFIPQISSTKPHQFTQNCFMGTPLCIYLLSVIAHSVSLPLGPIGLLPSSTEAGSLMAVCLLVVSLVLKRWDWMDCNPAAVTLSTLFSSLIPCLWLLWRFWWD